VHNLSFLVLHRLVGLETLPYFALVLATHLLNVALMFDACRRLGVSLAVAGLASLLWGTSPVHQESMRWFTAYGAVLGTTFALIALREIAGSIGAQRSMRPRELAIAVAALLLGAATVGGGGVVALVFPLVTLLALPSRGAPLRTSAIFGAVAVVVLVLSHLLGQRGTPSTLGDVAAAYAALFAYGAGTMVAGPLVTVSAGAIGPFSGVEPDVAVGIGGVLAAVVFAFAAVAFLRRGGRERALILGLLVLPAAQYVAVAWARTGFRGPNSVAWLATHSRYHYCETALLLIALAVTLGKRDGTREMAWPRRSRVIAGGAIWVAASFWVSSRASVPASEGTAATMSSLSANIRAAARQLPVGATLYLRNDFFRPVYDLRLIGVPRTEFPNIGAYWVIDHGTQPFEGRMIRFVERDAAAAAAVRASSIADVGALFVPPEEVTREGGVVRGLAELEAPEARAP